jgi:hypothetical protein
MTDFRDLTVRQLEVKAKEMERLGERINLLVDEIFKLNKYCWNEKGQPNGEWQNAINLDLEDKIKLIGSFIKTEYPEIKLKNMNKKEADFKKHVLEQEEIIAEAFETLARREEKINNEIKNHLVKNT